MQRLSRPSEARGRFDPCWYLPPRCPQAGTAGLCESCARLLPGHPVPPCDTGQPQGCPMAPLPTGAQRAPRTGAAQREPWARDASPSCCLRISRFLQFSSSFVFWQKSNTGREERQHLPNQTHAKLSMCRRFSPRLSTNAPSFTGRRMVGRGTRGWSSEEHVPLAPGAAGWDGRSPPSLPERPSPPGPAQELWDQYFPGTAQAVMGKRWQELLPRTSGAAVRHCEKFDTV